MWIFFSTLRDASDSERNDECIGLHLCVLFFYFMGHISIEVNASIFNFSIFCSIGK